MARGPRRPRLSRVVLYGGVDEREDPSTADARAQRKLRARGNGFSRQIHGGMQSIKPVDNEIDHGLYVLSFYLSVR